MFISRVVLSSTYDPPCSAVTRESGTGLLARPRAPGDGHVPLHVVILDRTAPGGIHLEITTDVARRDLARALGPDVDAPRDVGDLDLTGAVHGDVDRPSDVREIDRAAAVADVHVAV